MSTNKFLTFVNNGIALIEAIGASAGVADANKIVRTSSTGLLDSTLMPAGIGADTQTYTASEAIPAGRYVNITSTGIQLADNSNGRRADGYVLAAVASGAVGTVFRSGRNTGLTGLTQGVVQFLGTAGGVTSTAPIAVGTIIQNLGTAGSPTSLPFSGTTTIANV